LISISRLYASLLVGWISEYFNSQGNPVLEYGVFPLL
jgi:hypothetical protein